MVSGPSNGCPGGRGLGLTFFTEEGKRAFTLWFSREEVQLVLLPTCIQNLATFSHVLVTSLLLGLAWEASSRVSRSLV